MSILKRKTTFYLINPQMYDYEIFDFMKDGLFSFFRSQDFEFWELVLKGYVVPTNGDGRLLETTNSSL